MLNWRAPSSPTPITKYEVRKDGSTYTSTSGGLFTTILGQP
jgi:hypothetical protein